MVAWLVLRRRRRGRHRHARPPGGGDRRGTRDRVRRSGHRGQLLVLRPPARHGACRLPDRRGRRRWVERDHQARGHRRRRDGGDRDRSIALRDRRSGVRQSGCHRPLRLHHVEPGGPGSCAHQRRTRRDTAGAPQGRRQLSRRLPQCDDPGRHGARCAGQGRPRPAHDHGPIPHRGVGAGHLGGDAREPIHARRARTRCRLVARDGGGSGIVSRRSVAAATHRARWEPQGGRQALYDRCRRVGARVVPGNVPDRATR